MLDFTNGSTWFFSGLATTMAVTLVLLVLVGFAWLRGRPSA